MNFFDEWTPTTPIGYYHTITLLTALALISPSRAYQRDLVLLIVLIARLLQQLVILSPIYCNNLSDLSVIERKCGHHVKPLIHP